MNAQGMPGTAEPESRSRRGENVWRSIRDMPMRQSPAPLGLIRRRPANQRHILPAFFELRIELSEAGSHLTQALRADFGFVEAELENRQAPSVAIALALGAPATLRSNGLDHYWRNARSHRIIRASIASGSSATCRRRHAAAGADRHCLRRGHRHAGTRDRQTCPSITTPDAERHHLQTASAFTGKSALDANMRDTAA